MGDSTPSANVNEAGLYPIRTVATITGVKPVTLRAWERRYGLLQPQRTPKGHRMYSRADVERIHTILDLLEEGIPISQVPNALNEAGKQTAREAQSPDAGAWLGYRNRMLEAVLDFAEGTLEATHNDALALYPMEVVNRYLILPLLRDLRERCWEDYENDVYLRFFRAYLRNKLGERLLHHRGDTPGPRLLVAGLPGEPDDLNLLTLALAVQDRGFRVITLGPDLPLPLLRRAVTESHAEALVLVGGPATVAELLEDGLPALVRDLAIPLFLAGESGEGLDARLAEAGVAPLSMDTAEGLAPLDERLKADP
ncbi:MAG TPA: MerR family transcriptional regulator [Gammaproteobacteria bacterium]|nr:MerR family transcriptional regulator [Gammaproteobacteria bacterium]